MSNLQNYKIGVLIDADASKLQAEAKKADKAIDGIGSGGFAKVKGEFGNLASEFNLIPNSAAKASSSLSAMSGSVSGIAEAAGPAGIAIGALTVGITATVGIGIQLSKTLFDLAKQASDFGSEIYDASQKTGVGTETLSALKYAADTSGSSLEAVSGSVTKFSKLVADGSEESKKKIVALGLDPQTAINDLDGSLAKVFQRIADAENPIVATKLATDAFGKSGANMIPVIKSFDGNLDGLIKTATDLGLVLSEKDAEAADNFGDTLDVLTKQAEGAGYEFAYGFMPQITDAMSEISGVLADNKNDWRSWGEAVGKTISFTLHAITQTVLGLKSTFLILAAAAQGDWASATAVYSAYDAQFQQNEQAYQLGTISGQLGTISGNAKIKRPQPDYDFSGGGSSKGNKGSTAKTAKNSVEQEMRKTFTELGFTVVRTFGRAINEGSLHPLGRAIDLSIKGKTTEELFNAAIVGINKGWQLVDERVPRVGKNGKIKQTGPHFHFEKDGGKDPSLFLPANYYGGEAQLDYLKKLDADRVAGRLSGSSKFQKEQNQEIQKGIDFVTKYTESFNNLGETTHRISLEREKDFQKLSEPEKEKLRLLADEWDAVEKASKASEEYSNFISQLSDKYDAVNGVTKTFTESLNDQLQKLKENGVVLDSTAEGFARYRALILDVTETERQLNEEVEKQNRLRIEERDWQNYGNDKGIVAPSTITRDRYEAEPPRTNKSVSAWGIADSRGTDYKDGGIFDEKTINTQVSLMQTLKESGMDAFRSIAGEIGNAAAQWLAYGDSSEMSLGKATKAILASVSAQALGTGLYELGLGFAALTPWGAAIYGPAPLHFKSAAILMGIGAAFGGLARAVPGGKDSKSGGGSSISGSSSSASNNQDTRQYNFLRDSSVGSNQAQANNQLQLTVNELRNSVQQLTAANQELRARIATQPAGVLVANGIKENKGLVADTVMSEMSKNSTTANQFGRILGVG